VGLVTGTNLQNGSALIDAVRSALVAEGFTLVYDLGTIGSNNKEVWLTRAAAATLLGFDITIGLRMNGADRLELALTHLTPADANLTGVSPRNEFDRVLGVHNDTYSLTAQNPPGNAGDVYQGFTLTSAQDNVPVPTNGMNPGANYLRHWILTPDTTSPGTQEFYCYVVAEVATGVFRTFGFGEGIKLGGSGWSGGLFVSGTFIVSDSTESEHFLAGDMEHSPFTNNGQGGYVLNFTNDNYLTAASPNRWNPWMKMSDPAANGWVTVVGTGSRSLGLDNYTYSPAAFSGQAVRTPARFYGMNTMRVSSSFINRLRPLIEAPDVFHANIEDVTPGDVITDDADKFLVVPVSAKTGTNNTANRGFLIRNPDL
jgi:hypothetical protein